MRWTIQRPILRWSFVERRQVLVLVFCLLSVWFVPTTNAFVVPSIPNQKRRLQHTVVTSLSSPTSLQLILNWFGGGGSGGGGGSESNDSLSDASTTLSMNDNDDDDDNALGGVAGIMNTMEDFKLSQSLGQTTESVLNELQALTVEGTAENGKIKVILNGVHYPLSLQIMEGETYLQKTSAVTVSASILAALQDAHQKINVKISDKLDRLVTKP